MYTNQISPSQLHQNAVPLCNANPREKKKNLYVVVDTNVLLTELSIVEKLRDTMFKKYGLPYIVIPWTVIQVSEILVFSIISYRFLSTSYIFLHLTV